MKKYILALVSGVINGLFGTGGGTVALPMLSGILDEEKRAYQNVALFILPLSILSAAVYENTQQNGGLLYISVGAFFGGLTGAFLNKKIKLFYLNFLFGAVILYIGVSAFL